MESVTIAIDKAEEFDEIVHNSLPDNGELRVVTKAGGMVSGKSIAVLSFGVLVNGKMQRVQIVKSVSLLASTFGALISIMKQEEGIGN